ncbi:MAG: hypothetical protein K9W46_10580 [Candidatus Heimdallarchaeum endolithica]|uniref:Uncharacterized protein n=1 Tax=Candidatus Heimdallarchaeum endolithica TaxID=2876572 RepID=A0A9Y1BPU9_9ARCH|nr:MAG: hypothetical protein K9W46_10580 [Candidatus Heimdallarchaeum endolithica]
MRRKEEKNVYTPSSVVCSAYKYIGDKELGVLWISIQLEGVKPDFYSFVSRSFIGKKFLLFFSAFINYFYDNIVNNKTRGGKRRISSLQKSETVWWSL